MLGTLNFKDLEILGAQLLFLEHSLVYFSLLSSYCPVSVINRWLSIGHLRYTEAVHMYIYKYKTDFLFLFLFFYYFIKINTSLIISRLNQVRVST